jgi:acyl dehydratase
VREALPAPGTAARLRRRVTAADIEAFGGAIASSGPMHAGGEWVAQHTPYGEARVAHGFFTAALVSAAIVRFYAEHGLVGALYRTESRFVAPLCAGDEVEVSLTFEGQVPDRPRRIRFATEVRRIDGRVLMTGEVQEHLFSIQGRRLDQQEKEGRA